MYILFLTFRYLTRKKIVLFPILVVWLCVMMLIIVTSIMGGFVDRVREANRELYGDIIISAGSSSQGFAGYDALIAHLRQKFPEIQATTPVVEAYAILYATEYRQSVPALLVGVRPDERSQVSQFRDSLFQQHKSPTEAVEDLSPRLPASKDQLLSHAKDLLDASMKEANEARSAYNRLLTKAAERGPAPDGNLADENAPAYQRSLGLFAVAAVGILLFARARRLRNIWSHLLAMFVTLGGTGLVAATVFWPVLFPRQFDLAKDRFHQADARFDRAQRTYEFAARLPAGDYATRDVLAKALVPAKPTFDLPAEAKTIPGLPPNGCIVGAQLGFFERDARGNFVHSFPDHYYSVSITVFPPSKSGRINVNAINAVTQDFTIIDDSHTGVYDVDSLDVYAPFDLVQSMAGMKPEGGESRTHQVLIRVKPEALANLGLLRARMDDEVVAFMEKYAADHPDSFSQVLKVQTWDEKQAKYLGAVQNEKTMMTFIMLLMSGVVLVVIFLIFYMIVRDKTRDIGIIKAVGGSEAGVAAIFLTYGLMIGIVGGGLGVLTGCLFVTHTNEIHEFIYQMTGILIWDRSVYLFDRIPDVVHPGDVLLYYAVALFAGIAGALIPALLAAAEDPVQAVRYE